MRIADDREFLCELWIVIYELWLLSFEKLFLLGVVFIFVYHLIHKKWATSESD